MLEAPVGFLEMWSSRLATPCSNSARNAIQAVMPGFEDATLFFLGRWLNRIGPGTKLRIGVEAHLRRTGGASNRMTLLQANPRVER